MYKNASTPSLLSSLYNDDILAAQNNGILPVIVLSVASMRYREISSVKNLLC